MKGICLKGRYLLGEVIGKGGMAVVYKAYDFRTGKTLAVKVLREQFNTDQEFVRRFQQEAEAAATVSHENLIDIYDVGEQDGMRFIVMEYVDGMTLKSLIQEHGALDNYSAVTITRQICMALQMAHDAHIIHRDIKPQNILLDRKGIAKLADFGIAKTSDSQTMTAEQDSSVLGSVHYFSPEQARGETANAQSDLYSLGVVLYEMVTAQLPFSGETPVAIAMQHLNVTPKEPMEINPKVTKAISDIIMKAIRKDPAQRYQSAREFYDDLSLALVYPEGGFVVGEVKKEEPLEESPRKKAVKEKASETKHTKRLKSIIIVLCFVIILMSATVTLSFFTKRWSMAGRVRVPVVEGFQMEEAAALTDSMGLILDVNETVYSDTEPRGRIVSQSPAGGTKAFAGSTVSVVVSAGAENVEMPDLSEKTLEEAQVLLEQVGLKAGTVTEDETSTEPRGTVIGQNPAPGTLLSNGYNVELVISGSATVTRVPDLSGKTLAEAKALLAESGMSVGEVTGEYATGLQSGQIFRQLPEAGTESPKDSTVDIWVALEAKMATCSYELSLDIKDEGSSVVVYIEDESIYKEVYTNETCPKGKLEVELNLEAETAGEKKLIAFVNDEEVLREIVTFIGGE